MINPSETIFAFVLLNLVLGLLLNGVVVVYRFVVYRVLKLGVLGSYALIFTSLSIPLLLFLKPFDWVVLPITTLGSLGLIYDFFQNYKKCYLCSCSSLLIAYLCGVIIFGCYPQSKLALLAYLFLANFCLLFSCFGKVGAFVKVFCISLTATLAVFCLALFENQGIQSMLVGYLGVYCVFYICVFFFVTTRLFFSLARIIKKRIFDTKNSISTKKED